MLKKSNKNLVRKLRSSLNKIKINDNPQSIKYKDKMSTGYIGQVKLIGF
jgi:hypothetical protein